MKIHRIIPRASKDGRKPKLLSRLLCMLATIFTLTTGLNTQVAHANHASPRIPNIVLVHGAFADGSCWSEVIAILQSRGYHVTAVQNPLTSLADDVAATRQVLQRQKGDVLLVGHSWAGAVVTEAGNADNVKAIVYLSALVPDTNESVADMLGRLKAPMEGMAPDENGLIWLDNSDTYREVMAGDLSAEKVRALAAIQQPIAARTFEGKVTRAAWRYKPSWYLTTESDHALPLNVQQALAKQIGAKTISLNSSHMSMLSHPVVVANLIDQAAKASNGIHVQ